MSQNLNTDYSNSVGVIHLHVNTNSETTCKYMLNSSFIKNRASINYRHQVGIIMMMMVVMMSGDVGGVTSCEMFTPLGTSWRDVCNLQQTTDQQTGERVAENPYADLYEQAACERRILYHRLKVWFQ